MNKKFGLSMLVIALFALNCSKVEKKLGEKKVEPKSKPQKTQEESFNDLLEKVDQSIPRTLQGYESTVLVDGKREASGSFSRSAKVQINLEKKIFTVTVIDPPKKNGVQRKTGNSLTRAYIDNGQVWLEQKFKHDPIGNWKLPVKVVGNTLVAPASSFTYLDTSEAAIHKRKSDIAYNLKRRAAEAGFKETSATQYLFIFGLDPENRGIYFDREITNVTSEEKDLVEKIQIRIALTETQTNKGED